jgi:maleylpyruvate isomerase
MAQTIRPAVEVVGLVRMAHTRVAGLVDGLTDAQARAASVLPGWSRGHVITHLAELARAFVRQVDIALDGRTAEVYEGGRPARDAAIEAKAGRPAAELRADLLAANTELENAWQGLTDADWARPIRYRDGVLLGTAYARWRETEIHAADLDLGYRSADWSDELVGYLVDFLAARVQDGVALTITAGRVRRTIGSGAPVAVQGELTDVVAWLAGRTPIGELATTAPLPELGRWP